MDVFIPEEYVVRRRLEKKAAAMATKTSDQSSRRVEMKKQVRTADKNEYFVIGCHTEIIVFSCFSA